MRRTWRLSEWGAGKGPRGPMGGGTAGGTGAGAAAPVPRPSPQGPRKRAEPRACPASPARRSRPPRRTGAELGEGKRSAQQNALLQPWARKPNRCLDPPGGGGGPGRGAARPAEPGDALESVHGQPGWLFSPFRNGDAGVFGLCVCAGSCPNGLLRFPCPSQVTSLRGAGKLPVKPEAPRSKPFGLLLRSSTKQRPVVSPLFSRGSFQGTRGERPGLPGEAPLRDRPPSGPTTHHSRVPCFSAFPNVQFTRHASAHAGARAHCILFGLKCPSSASTVHTRLSSASSNSPSILEAATPLPGSPPSPNALSFLLCSPSLVSTLSRCVLKDFPLIIKATQSPVGNLDIIKKLTEEKNHT